MNNIPALAKQGIKSLIARQIIVQLTLFSGGVALARILTPAEFGLYAITSFMVGVFALIGDFGLAPSFIQRQAELKEKDLCVGFTLQQIITTSIVVLILLLAPFLVSLYPQTPPETVWLVRVLAFNLYLASWRTMSALQLERQLRFKQMVWPETAGQLIYQALAVGLAFLGYGVWSFIWATLANGVFVTVALYLAAPWRIRLSWDKKTVKEILAFGIPFQLQSIVNQVANWITPTLVAGLLGPQAVGYLMWAVGNGKRPLMFVDSIARVAFPHLSRLQDDPQAVARVLTKYLTYLLLPAGLWLALMLIAGRHIIQLVYTDKWVPAVPAVMMYAAAVASDIIVWLVAVAVNSSGNVSFTTRYFLWRNLGIVAASVMAVSAIGYNGVPAAYLLLGTATMPFVFIGLGQGARRKILTPLAWLFLPLAASVLLGSFTFILSLSLLPQVVVSAGITTLVYAGAAWLFAPLWLKSSVQEELAKYVKFVRLKPVSVTNP